MNDEKQIRLWQIDFLRGFAVIGMIVFHTFFIFNFFTVGYGPLEGFSWLIFERFIQFTFIGLIGVTLTFSRKKYKTHIFRGLKILGLAAIISIVTYIFDPKTFVKFGILHFIGTSIILIAPLSQKKYINLFLGIGAFIIGEGMGQITTTNIFLYIIGFQSYHLPGLDYFPIFPWISIIFSGMFLGNIMKEKFKTTNMKMPKILTPITFLGKHSLMTYMVHIPVIIGALWIFGEISQ
ncbi:MAG: heparan-alpha-glucosaminide N-acetyltransferase [Patescibacteria group bacterium]